MRRNQVDDVAIVAKRAAGGVRNVDLFAAIPCIEHGLPGSVTLADTKGGAGGAGGATAPRPHRRTRLERHAERQQDRESVGPSHLKSPLVT